MSRVHGGAMTCLPIMTGHPYIDTPTTRQLVRRVDDLCIRRPDVSGMIAAVRAGDNAALLTLVRDAQGGNGDAAIIAIVALLSRLCSVIFARGQVTDWKASVDDYVSIAFLVIRDVGPGERAEHLADRIIARARRRHERYAFAHQPIPYWDGFLIENGPTADDVERQALARVELDEIRKAARAGVITADQYRTIIAAHLAPGGRPNARERSLVARGRRKLDTWRAETEAA